MKISSERCSKSTAVARVRKIERLHCIAKGSLSKNNWVFVISFVRARDGAGNPLIAPGDWVGITVDPEGHVIDRMAGD